MDTCEVYRGPVKVLVPLWYQMLFGCSSLRLSHFKINSSQAFIKAEVAVRLSGGEEAGGGHEQCFNRCLCRAGWEESVQPLP